MTAAILPFTQTDPGIAAALSDEMTRIGLLVATITRHRDGKPATQDQKRDLMAANERVTATRKEGFWETLLGQPDPVEPLAADALAVALFPVLWPSRGFQITALQSGITEMAVSQALAHELLMLAPAEEMRMHWLLSPVGPLLADHWIEAEGNGPARLLRPGPRLLRRVLGEDAFGSLPAGISLLDSGTGDLPALILQPDVTAALDEVTALARHSCALHDAGTRAPGGPAVLLTGPPGTGKSLAARHLSRRLGRPLFQLNLGTLVSKWLGETERNLSRVFDQMSGTTGCILIDECDSLLGKRVSVKEGRDHYVNLTVSHLLMLLERHKGPVFLTSNLRSNLDDAYIRRFSAVVDFRRPDKGLRRQAWLREIGPALPAPQAADLAQAAATVDLSAAEIANACHYARALAQAENAALTLAHVARAVQRERTKSNATFSRADLIGLAEHLPDGGEGGTP